jgi:hypothetical protein
MARRRFLFGLLFVIGWAAGCGGDDARGAREVPATKPRDASSTSDPAATTKAPRAIATH